MKKTNVYGLLGEVLPHSFSPRIHRLLGEYEYRLFERSPEELTTFLSEEGFAGINVTIPYKKAVIPYLSALSDEARRTGSVNTVVRTETGLVGHNTDYHGFLYMLDRIGVSVKGKKCLVLGSGGASATVQAALSDRGAEAVVISRRGENNYENLDRHEDAALIVNTTPVGMYPDNGKAPLSLSRFPRLLAVIDIVYNPRRTALLLEAEDRGIPAVGGLPMLAMQAVRANELFFGRPQPESTGERILAELERQTENVILIGMPGCGKSTAGRALAAAMGLRFFDTDEEIETVTGRSPAAIIEAEGEDAFRKIEHETILRLGKETGAVIATGGGVVTRPENRDPLRQNGTVVYLTRPLCELAKNGRPLSGKMGVDALYAARRPLYEAWAERTVHCNKDVSVTVKNIQAALSAKKE